jgi:dolichol-phosphate mannosyltransferase
MSVKRQRRGLPAPFWRSAIQRPAKFALVGALGIVVQLLTIEALTAIGLQYLWATGLAVEAAVLHNFLWHQRFTWSDRCAQTGIQLVRFHLGNGTISIFGSLLLMRFLVGQFGMGVLVANLLPIGACSVGNFLASDRWVFLSPCQPLPSAVHTESSERSPIRSSVRCAKGT